MCNQEREQPRPAPGRSRRQRRSTAEFVAPVLIAATALAAAAALAQSPAPPDRRQVADTMKRATAFMVDKVSTNGGYVWSYLPDFSRRWGELEARPTQIWVQPPGTATMGHLFLDAYHATRDEYYYQAAEKAAAALIAGQHPSGGWNYLIDVAGPASEREWYDTVGRNAWRMEEFQHNWGNATFDDGGTAEATKFLLRLFVEKRDRRYEPALEKAIRFVLDSQYPVGAWPQRFPQPASGARPPTGDYTAYWTFNDDVAAENLDVLLSCYQVLGDERLLDPIARGMNAFLVTEQPAPQAGWALQYTPDGQPAGARTYEPKALVTHTSARNVELLVKFFRLTGDGKFLARIPEALDWLEGLRLPAGIAPAGRTHPTFVEPGTNKPLYVHRRGSNVVNGQYYVDNDPQKTIVHYSSFRRVDVAALRKLYEEARAMSPEQATKGSPLAPGAGRIPLPRFYAVAEPGPEDTAAEAIAALNEQGYWLAPIGYNSHPYHRPGTKVPAPGDFSQTYVGDESDTSPYPDAKLMGISTAAYIRNMSALIRYLEGTSLP